VSVPECADFRLEACRTLRPLAVRLADVLVAMPQPFSFELTTDRFRLFGHDPANVWADGRLHRLLDGREVAIGPAPDGAEVAPSDPALAAPVRRLLGAGFDLSGFARFAAADDAVLARLADALPGLRPALVPDPWEALVTAITAQQVSLRAASAIRARFVHALGERHERAWAFPSRERVARESPDALRALGFSTRKAEYAVGLARAPLDLDGLGALPDDEVKAALTALPGLGEWTADWFLARHLGRPRAWPAGDLALRKAVSTFYAGGRPTPTAEVRALGGRFGEHANLAAHTLLAGLRRLAV
jgi:DNA-3-methyladenine glycosylase II